VSFDATYFVELQEIEDHHFWFRARNRLIQAVVGRFAPPPEARGLALEIEVDGGIRDETVGPVAAAGANVFVAGTAVFGAPDYRVAVRGIRGAAERARG